MGLSCECPEYDHEPGSKWWEPGNYTTLDTKKRKRCCSCGELIEIGAIVVKVTRIKIADTEIEERIFGEGGEIGLAPHYLCEKDADIFFSLDELGFCITPYDNMSEHLSQYAELYGKKQQK